MTTQIEIPAGKTVVLDLNGKTVSMTYTEDKTENHTMISNSGNLTIKSSVENSGKLSYELLEQNGKMLKNHQITSQP